MSVFEAPGKLSAEGGWWLRKPVIEADIAIAMGANLLRVYEQLIG